MNGINKITDRIAQDAQAKAAEVLAQARAQAEGISADYGQQAAQVREDILAQGREQAAHIRERAEGAAQLEARKRILAVKQELLDGAFRAAVQSLRDQPKEEYINFLAGLMAAAATTGKEKVIFSPADRAQVGKEAVTRANELLAKASGPKLPDAMTQGRLGAVLDKVVTVGSAIAKGGMLTLSEETREMSGGFVLQGGLVEVNCTLDTLVAQEKDRLSGEIAKTLFPQ